MLRNIFEVKICLGTLGTSGMEKGLNSRDFRSQKFRFECVHNTYTYEFCLQVCEVEKFSLVLRMTVFFVFIFLGEYSFSRRRNCENELTIEL